VAYEKRETSLIAVVWSKSSGSGRRVVEDSCVHGKERVLSIRGRDLFLAPWATVYSSGTPLHHVKYEFLCSCHQHYSYINRSLIVLHFCNPVSYGMKLKSFIAFLKLYSLEIGTLFSSTCQTWKTDAKHIISLSKFFIYQLMHKWIVLKTILKFIIKLALI
jgi:hypothetical protein